MVEKYDLPAMIPVMWHCRQTTRASNDVVLIFHSIRTAALPTDQLAKSIDDRIYIVGTHV